MHIEAIDIRLQCP